MHRQNYGHITPQFRDRACRLYREGLTAKETAEVMGCSEQAVLNWLEDRGIDKSGPSKRQRFLKHTKVCVPWKCWEWQGSRNSDGYGSFRVQPEGMLQAHRVAYRLFVGGVPSNKHVLHTCDNPPCVNPTHLWLGTHGDNMRDMVQKGRRDMPQGEDHHNSKLSNAQACEIKRRADNGEPHIDIAKDFPVTPGAVWHIAIGNQWKEIT